MAWLDLILVLSCQVVLVNMALVAKQSPQNPYGETSEIIQFLKEGEKAIRISPSKDVVLVLGKTGSGKSTLTQFVTGNDEHLVSVELGEETGEYVIRDKGNKVCNVTQDSCTTVPDLMVDRGTQTPFYDCPGFVDTRHMKHDLSVTYFIKKIMDSADSVKLVFTASYPDLRVGVDRQNFMLLLKNAIKIIKDIDKFEKSIALIVTKVDNTIISRKGKSYLVSDQSIIKNIASFLGEVKSNLQVKISQNVGSDSVADMEKSVKFIDVLLTRDGEEYPRIGIFRRPDTDGKLETPHMLENKNHLGKIIHENLEFTHCNSDDFGYTVSAETVNRIYQIAELVNRKIESDVRAIGREMSEGFHLLERDVNDVETLYRKFYFGHEAMKNISKISSADPRDLLMKIRQAASVLDLDVPKQNVDSILHYDRFLKFIRVLSGMDTSNQLVWAEGLKEVVHSFDDSQKWYNFLMNLHATLLNHDVQKHLSKDSTTMDLLRDQIQHYDADDSVIKEPLQRLLTQVYLDDSDKDFNGIKDVRLNSWKLKFLKDMLDFQVTTLCQNDKLVVVGNYVHLSDVSRKQCKNVKFVEIFALSKLFLDADFDRTGSKIQMSILSPTWEVIGSPKITLDGQPGWEHVATKANNGIGPGADGIAGLPGLPGGAAGNFFGFGWNCVNCQYLKVSANGGRGGKGQDGGDGVRGKDGQRPSSYNHYRNKFNFIVTVSHEDRSSTGQPGGNGGMGGAGGEGGSAGQISMVMFNTPETNLPKTTAENGNSGSSGSGGLPGSGGESEHIIESHTYILGMHAWSNGIVSSLFFPSGDGASTSEINYDGLKDAEPPVAPVNPSHPINSYKAYLRENLDSSLSRLSLEEFLNQLETSEEIVSLYDTLGLVHDLQSLENQFYKLHHRIPLLPFYRSLLYKIETYARDPKYSEMSGQHKKVLAFLYMSTLSKICTLDYNMNNDLVINVKDYLGAVVRDVDQLLKGSMVAKQKNEQRAMFHHAITNRVKEAKEFIELDIASDIEMILAELDHHIRALVSETHQLQTITRNELERLNEYMIARAVSSVVKVACMALDFFGGLGAVAEGVIESTNLVTDSLSFDNPDSPVNKLLGVIPATLNEFFGSLTDHINDKITRFVNQLFNIDGILQNLGGKFAVLNETRTTVLEATEEFSRPFELSESPEEDLVAVDSKRNQLIDFLQTQRKALEDLHPGDPGLEKALGALDKSTEILRLPTGVYNALNGSKAGILRKFGEEDKLRQLEEYETRIYSVIVPLCKKLKQQFDKIDSFSGESLVALDVGKWKVQNALTNVQSQISSMTAGFQAQGPLESTIDKLKFGISTMIQVYDRIQNYYDQAALADYIADLSSTQANAIEITDRKLKDANDNLQVIMKINLILSEYEKAMSAFGQHVFPFAGAYMAEYDLPTSLKSEDTDDLLSEAIYKINSIDRKLIKNDLIINAMDNHVFWEVQFTSRSSLGPFYVWKYETLASEISQLLQGKEVVLHADIVKGLNYNAVKFNEIGIRFNFPNAADQIEFDEIMENFYVEMNHFGVSYYRCGGKFYVMSHDSQKIAHSVNEDDQGRYNFINSVYSKISKNSPLLSPYTMWKVRLHNTSRSFDDLAKFDGAIVDVALEGKGMFVKRDIDHSVCNDHLHRYYKVDDSVTEVPAIEYKVDRNLTDVPEVVVARHRRDISGEYLYQSGEDSQSRPLSWGQVAHWFMNGDTESPTGNTFLGESSEEATGNTFFSQRSDDTESLPVNTYPGQSVVDYEPPTGNTYLGQSREYSEPPSGNNYPGQSMVDYEPPTGNTYLGQSSEGTKPPTGSTYPGQRSEETKPPTGDTYPVQSKEDTESPTGNTYPGHSREDTEPPTGNIYPAHSSEDTESPTENTYPGHSKEDTVLPSGNTYPDHSSEDTEPPTGNSYPDQTEDTSLAPTLKQPWPWSDQVTFGGNSDTGNDHIDLYDLYPFQPRYADPDPALLPLTDEDMMVAVQRNLLMWELLMPPKSQDDMLSNEQDLRPAENTLYRAYDPANDKEVIIVQ